MQQRTGREGWRSAIPVIPFALAFAWAVARAARLSITFDEAESYLLFVRPDRIWEFSTNNHVLSSLLMRVSTALFGSSELALRLPALAGAALYLVAMWRVVTLVFPGTLARFVTGALVSWNPLLLDFFSLARGYGLALGFLTLAFLLLALELRGQLDGWATGAVRPRVCVASIAAALSVAGNWSFLFMNTGLCAGFLVASGYAIRTDPRVPARFARWRTVLFCLTLPGLIVAAVVIRPFLAGMLTEKHIVGFDTSSVDSARDLVNASFFHRATATRGPDDLLAYTVLQAPHDRWQDWTMRIGAPILTAGIAAMLLVLLVRSGWLLNARARDALGRRITWLAAFALAFNWALHEIAHRMTGLRYPLDRTLMYAIPFTLLVSCATLFALQPSRTLTWAGAGMLTFLFVCTQVQNDPRYFRSWLYCRGIRSFFEAYARDQAAAPNRAARMGGAQAYAMALDYYLVTRAHESLPPYEVTADPNDPAIDYVVCHAGERVARCPRDSRTIANDPLSETKLARKMAAGGRAGQQPSARGGTR